MVRSLQCGVGHCPRGDRSSQVVRRIASYKPDSSACDEWSGCNLSQELPGVEMKTGTKAVYINCAIAVGLLLELHWGRPLYVVGITGIVLFVVANLILIFSKRAHGR